MTLYMSRVAFCCSYLVAVQCQSYWSTLAGNSQRTGFAACLTSQDSKLIPCCKPSSAFNQCSTNGSIAWAFPRNASCIDWAGGNTTVGAVHASVVIAPASVRTYAGWYMIYLASTDGRIFALNSSTGCSIWTFATNASFLYTPSITAAGVLLAPNTNGLLYALNGTNGSMIWSFNTGYKGVPSPTVLGESFIFLSGSTLIALHQNNGTQAFTTRKDVGNDATLAALYPDCSFVVACMSTAGFQVMNAFTTNDGQNPWGFEVPQYCLPPIVYNGTVYSITDENPSQVQAVDSTGFLVWQQEVYSSPWGMPAIIPSIGAMIVTGMPGITALSLIDGSQLWASSILQSFTTARDGSRAVREGSGAVGYGSGPAVGYDGTVYVPVGSSLIALQGATGISQWSANAPCATTPIYSTPAIGPDGRVYVTYACEGVGTVMDVFESMPAAQLVTPLVTPSPSPSPSAAPTVPPVWFTSNANMQRTSQAVGNQACTSTGQLVWTSAPVSMLNTAVPQPITDGTRVFYMDDNGGVTAISLENGTTLWRYSGSGQYTNPPGLTVSPDGMIYVPGVDGMRALAASNGATLWFTPSVSAMWGTPIFDASLANVFISSTEANSPQWSLWKLNRYTGSVVWSIPLMNIEFTAACGTPALALGGTLLVLSSSDFLLGVATSNGAVLWYAQTVNYADPFTCGPVVSNLNTSYEYAVSSFGGYINVVYTMNGEHAAGLEINVIPISPPAVNDAGTILLAGDGLYGLTDGGLTIAWVINVPAGGCAPTIGADGTVYVFSSPDTDTCIVSAVSLATRSVIWQYNLPFDSSVYGSPIVTANGTLLVPVIQQETHTVSIWAFGSFCKTPPSPTSTMSVSATPTITASASESCTSTQVYSLSPTISVSHTPLSTPSASESYSSTPVNSMSKTPSSSATATASETQTSQPYIPPQPAPAAPSSDGDGPNIPVIFGCSIGTALGGGAAGWYWRRRKRKQQGRPANQQEAGTTDAHVPFLPPPSAPLGEPEGIMLTRTVKHQDEVEEDPQPRYNPPRLPPPPPLPAHATSAGMEHLWDPM
jgi:outer membrane protein assembly factor BamB